LCTKWWKKVLFLLSYWNHITGSFYDVSYRDAPDTGTVFAGYPAIPKAGYRISGRISGKGRIPDIRPDTLLDNYTRCLHEQSAMCKCLGRERKGRFHDKRRKIEKSIRNNFCFLIFPIKRLCYLLFQWLLKYFLLPPPILHNFWEYTIFQ
jgi:hypothetical protein